MAVDIGEVKRHIKPKADSTLYNMRKADLIEYIRTLEHNYNVAVSFNENQVKYIESLNVQQWIPVSEKAPKAPCLIFDANKNVPSVADGVITITDERHGTWFCDIKMHYWTQGKEKFVSYGNRITHWMPLPEPPK